MGIRISAYFPQFSSAVRLESISSELAISFKGTVNSDRRGDNRRSVSAAFFGQLPRQRAPINFHCRVHALIKTEDEPLFSLLNKINGQEESGWFSGQWDPEVTEDHQFFCNEKWSLMDSRP